MQIVERNRNLHHVDILLLEIKNRKDKKIRTKWYSYKKYSKTKYNHFVHTYIQVHAASARRHCNSMQVGEFQDAKLFLEIKNRKDRTILTK